MHPHGLCTYFFIIVHKPHDIIEDLREDICQGRQAADELGPLLVEQFLQRLSGAGA
jgi:hypothetical protein